MSGKLDCSYLTLKTSSDLVSHVAYSLLKTNHRGVTPSRNAEVEIGVPLRDGDGGFTTRDDGPGP